MRFLGLTLVDSSAEVLQAYGQVFKGEGDSVTASDH